MVELSMGKVKSEVLIKEVAELRIDELCPEVLIEVLSYIEPKDVSSCLTVNKYFNHVICELGYRLKRHSANMDISYISDSKMDPIFRLNVNVFKKDSDARKTLNVDFSYNKMRVSGTMSTSFVNSLPFGSKFSKTTNRKLKEHHSLTFALKERITGFRVVFAYIFAPTINYDRIMYDESIVSWDSVDYAEFLTVVQDALQSRPRQAIKMATLNLKNTITDCHRGMIRMIDQERLQWCSITISKTASLAEIMSILPKNSSKWLNLNVPTLEDISFDDIHSFLLEWKSGARRISKFNLRSMEFLEHGHVDQNIIEGISRIFKCRFRPETAGHIGTFGKEIDDEKLQLRLEPSCFMFTTNNGKCVLKEENVK